MAKVTKPAVAACLYLLRMLAAAGPEAAAAVPALARAAAADYFASKKCRLPYSFLAHLVERFPVASGALSSARHPVLCEQLDLPLCTGLIIDDVVGHIVAASNKDACSARDEFLVLEALKLMSESLRQKHGSPEAAVLAAELKPNVILRGVSGALSLRIAKVRFLYNHLPSCLLISAAHSQSVGWRCTSRLRCAQRGWAASAAPIPFPCQPRRHPPSVPLRRRPRQASRRCLPRWWRIWTACPLHWQPPPVAPSAAPARRRHRYPRWRSVEMPPKAHVIRHSTPAHPLGVRVTLLSQCAPLERPSESNSSACATRVDNSLLVRHVRSCASFALCLPCELWLTSVSFTGVTQAACLALVSVPRPAGRALQDNGAHGSERGKAGVLRHAHRCARASVR